jgi:tRNA/tmRNA/rRNA uracil-C5-methylase (TrmA/RlmC/RlmD family)
MTEGELGQHHKASYTSYNKSLYNFHVEGSVDISPPSYEQQQEIKRKELMDYIKYYLGPKASAFENLNFAANLLADQLMIQNLAKKKELHRPTNATHIGTPRTEIDPEKVLDKYNSQIKDLKNKIRKDLDEYIPDKNLYEKRQQKS